MTFFYNRGWSLVKSPLAQFVAAIALFGITVCGWLSPQPVRAQGSDSTRAANASFGERPRHVFLVVLENEGFETTFGTNSAERYLSTELTSKGELLTQYFAIGHFSLDNYIAMVSGQAPTKETQADCSTYLNFAPPDAALDGDGQVHGSGCVYPSTVLTIANQLEAKGLTWRGYMEDMSRNCQHVELGHEDDHIQARPGDQYATRHNPFVYFHSIIDHPTCKEHVVPLTAFDEDLQSVATTPNLAFITPNLCNDGHDGASAICPGGHLKSADHFLRQFVPKILASPAYQRDGMLMITFDEAEIGQSGGRVDPKTTDATACCDEPSGPNTSLPGLTGPGGGRIGAVILSQYVKPGSRNDTPYNHYALLRGLEDLFGLDYLGFAKLAGPPFDGVYNRKP
jgi:phosphatidylinositol-3-phosphatase